MFEEDRIQTSAGELKMTFVGHGTLIFTFPRSRPASRDGGGAEGGKVFHVDPYSRLADYEMLPKADVILVTHSHGDHFDPKAIAAVRKEGTAVVLTENAASEMPGGIVMKNGEARTVAGIRIEAVPAYNVAHKRPTGEPFHPRGEGNGYVLSFGATRVYVAGDTGERSRDEGTEGHRHRFPAGESALHDVMPKWRRSRQRPSGRRCSIPITTARPI